jgi:hypothetical protein
MTLVTRFCQMSLVRSTSDGKGPVTRKRIPDREDVSDGVERQGYRHGPARTVTMYELAGGVNARFGEETGRCSFPTGP